MSLELAFVLALLGTAIVMFAINRPRMDAVGLLVLTALPFTGVLTMSEALAGFSDPNIVLIAALFVIGDGLVRTGVARQLGDWLTTKAGSSETRLVVLLMIVVCGLGATMSSTAVTAIFIPVVLRIAQTTGTSPGQLMMPLSVAALISGMTTLVATAPNLVVNSELLRQGHTGFRFFSFTPFGVPILILAIGYMLLARRWLPASDRSGAKNASRGVNLKDWVDQYGLSDREQRVRVTPASPLVGKAIEDVQLRDRSGINLLAIERAGTLLTPTAKTVFQSDDVLFIDLIATSADADDLRKQFALEALSLTGSYFTDRSQEIGMAEVMLPADSELVGHTLVGSRFRDRTGLTAIGLKRGTTPHGRGFATETLKLGDTLLVIGPWKRIERLHPDESGVVLLRVPSEIHEVLPAAGKSAAAIASLGLVIGLMVTGLVPNVQAALIGCLLMGLLGCIDLNSAYRSIDWKTIVLIVGMLPFSVALQRTGGVDLASDALMRLTSEAGTHGVLAAIFAITALLGMFISNTATAVLMAPVALAIAKEMHASPYPFAMIVALAASTAFMTPVSSPVNTLVVAPGNYTFGHFLRVGVPFSLIVMAVCVFLVPLLLPM